MSMKLSRCSGTWNAYRTWQICKTKRKVLWLCFMCSQRPSGFYPHQYKFTTTSFSLFKGANTGLTIHPSVRFSFGTDDGSKQRWKVPRSFLSCSFSMPKWTCLISRWERKYEIINRPVQSGRWLLVRPDAADHKMDNNDGFFKLDRLQPTIVYGTIMAVIFTDTVGPIASSHVRLWNLSAYTRTLPHRSKWSTLFV